MKYSLLELRKYQEQTIELNETLDLKEAVLARDSQVIDLAPVQVSGFLEVKANEYFTHYHLTTVMTLPSSRSLEPVAVPLSVDVDELFMTPEQFKMKDDSIADEEVLILDTQTLDLEASFIDNLLLAIPLQVLSEEERQNDDLPSGNDWQVISEDEYLSQKQAESENQIDPRLAKLSALLDSEDEDK
ncbi:MAG: DUF177 domain-containing protein [Enterococcus cecorum]|nr:DUF177 domain-containing protein [Enterococcus cecorum]